MIVPCVISPAITTIPPISPKMSAMAAIRATERSSAAVLICPLEATTEIAAIRMSAALPSANQRKVRTVRTFSHSERKVALTGSRPRRSARGTPLRATSRRRRARAGRWRSPPRALRRAPPGPRVTSWSPSRLPSKPACTSVSRKAAACGERTRVPPAARAVNSLTGPCAMSLPWWMITTSSTSCCISPSTWLEMNTVFPSAANVRRKSRSQRIPSGSSPLAGSSRTSRFGSPSSAPATLSRWRMPSE